MVASMTVLSDHQYGRSAGARLCSKGSLRVSGRCSRCLRWATRLPASESDPAGNALGDLLEDPRVAVRVGERRLADVRATLRIAPGLGLSTRCSVEDVADLDAATPDLGVGGLDVVDDQQQTLQRRTRGRAELDRGRGAGRSELHTAHLLGELEIDVELPPQALVEVLRPVEVGDRDAGHFELHGHSRQV